MTLSPGKELEKRLDHPLYGDAYLAGAAATFVVLLQAFYGPFWSLFLAVLVGLPCVFFIAVSAGLMSGDDPTSLSGRLAGSATFSLFLAACGWSYFGTVGLIAGAATFPYLAFQVIRRHRQLPAALVTAALAPAATPALAAPPAYQGPPAFAPVSSTAPADIPGPVGVAVAQLPANLGVDLRARVDAAVENFRQLHEILHDPILLANVAVDAPGMMAAAEEVALDLLRQVPRLARIQALAARRTDDAEARAAAAAAFAAIDRHADALHQAASAAFKIVAAGPDPDVASLREHTDRLQELRAAHDELQTQ